MTNTKKLTTSAMLVSLSAVLMLISKMFPAPWMQGGMVTLSSMTPIIIISIRNGTKWGLISGFVFAVIHMMTGFYPPPTQNFVSFFLVVMLDYILAFGVLGLSGLFCRAFSSKLWAIPLSGFITTTLRYLCHILSGVLIWHVFAENQTVLAYAVAYNGSYMIPEIIITTISLALLSGY